MKKIKKLKKVKMPIFLKDLKEQVFRKAISALGIMLFFTVLFTLVTAFMFRLNYFRLRYIEARDVATKKAFISAPARELLKTYRGVNIFDVDMKAIARSMQASYTGTKEIIVKRVLPDKLEIDFNFRKPVAILGETPNSALDDECFAIPNPDARSLKGLPVITGINTRDDERRGRKAIESQNLKAALSLLKEMRKTRFPVENNVATIDAGDINNLSFSLASGLEIKIGFENHKERLATLKKLLRDPRLVIDKIQYIDLRFKDVIVGPKA